MRITLVMGFFLPVPALQGGATEKIWLRLGEGLAAAGHEVALVSRAWPGLPERDTTGPVHHLRLPGWNHTASLVRNLWLDFRWGRRVRSHLPVGDVVVCNTVTLPIGLRRARPDAGRVVVVLGRMPKGQVRAYGSVDLLLATSEAVAVRARHENPRLSDRIVRMPNPIDWSLHQAAAQASRDHGPVEIGYVGRIHPEKGLEWLLEAGVRLLSRPGLPDWHLSLTGPVTIAQGGGGEAYRDQLLARVGGALGSRLTFRPPVFDPAALARVYGSLQVFCYPSRAVRGEGLSIAPLEAMAAGAVPVVSQLDCYRDVIVDGENGLTFAHAGPDPAGALTDCLASLVADSGRRTQLARAAQTTARRYDYAETTACLLREFARLTGMPART